MIKLFESRITDLEESLGKLQRSYSTNGSYVSKYRYNFNLKTYLLNIQLLAMCFSYDVEIKFKEIV